MWMMRYVAVACMLFYLWSSSGSNIPVAAQQVLAASAFQTCASVSFGNVQLNCSQTQSTATVLLVRTAYVPTDDTASTFQFNVASLPVTPGETQLDTSTACTAPTPVSNLCGVSTPMEVRIQATRPVLRYRLQQRRNFQVPFAYWYTVVDADCQDTQCRQQRVSTFQVCSFQGATSSKAYADAAKCAPTASLVEQEFQGQIGRPFATGDHIHCDLTPRVDSYLPPNGELVDPGTSALVYNFDCSRLDGSQKTRVRMYGMFYQLGPMCNVYVPESPEVVGRITVTLRNTDTGAEEQVQVDTSNYETAASSSDGSVLVRVINQQSATDDTGQNIGGAILVCGDGEPAAGSLGTQIVPPLEMFAAGADVLQNPWLQFSEEQVGYTMPAAQLLQLTRPNPTTPPNLFWWWVDAVRALAMGRQCGELGVAPNYYEQGFLESTDFSYLRTFNSLTGYPYSRLLGVERIQTCVPGFGLDYRGLNFSTPCQAAAYFARMNNGSLEQRMQRLLVDQQNQRAYVPSMYSSVFPNVAFQGEDMYVYQPLDVQWEVSIAARGDFLGVIQQVVSGSIDRTIGTGCSLLPGQLGHAGTVSVRVCSGVPAAPAVAAYLAYAQCNAAGGIAVAPPVQLLTRALGVNECQLLVYQLVSTSALVVSQAQCTVFLSSSAATVSFVPNASIVLDQVQLQCVVADNTLPGSNTTPPLLVDGVTLGNGSVVPGATVTFTQPDGTTDMVILISVIVLVIIGAVLISAFVAICWVRVTRSKSAEVEFVQ